LVERKKKTSVKVKEENKKKNRLEINDVSKKGSNFPKTEKNKEIQKSVKQLIEKTKGRRHGMTMKKMEKQLESENSSSSLLFVSQWR
jgi:hypothetical protein